MKIENTHEKNENGPLVVVCDTPNRWTRGMSICELTLDSVGIAVKKKNNEKIQVIPRLLDLFFKKKI